MRKRILSLLIVLALCLGLLPVTALAADMNTVYVGGVELAGSSTSIAYATTNENGEVITEGATADNYNIKWDSSTLTLRNATIKKELHAYEGPLSNITEAAIGVLNNGGNAKLTITGGGILFVNSNSGPIFVISSNGNAALGIKNAKVTATSSYGNGVTIQSGNSENSSASLTVDGGSLTATAESSNVSGIRLRGTGETGGSSSTGTVSNNAIVRANGSAGGITSDFSTGVQYGTGGEETGGIVFDGKNGTVYGDVTLQKDLEIGEGESLTLDDGANLSAGDHNVIVDDGTLDESLANSLGDSAKYVPAITNHPKNVEVKEDETATFTVEATGSDLSYQWQQKTSGSGWMDITG